MREIKFRIKDRLGHKEWYYGVPVRFPEGKYCCFTSFDGSFYSAFAELDTLGQHTGLKDANGVDIYEGDIVKSNDKLYIVSYDEYGAQFLFCNDEEDMGYGNLFIVEVIGNIWDNPELLEGDSND